MNTTDATSLSTSALRDALHTAARWLQRNRDAINAINVYPVPDGDTGTNMLLTFRAALDAGDRAGAVPAGEYMAAFSRGALLGARGNSGVILSQMFRGAALALEGVEVVDGDALRRALSTAATTAYEAVSAPVEGTMLTVMREAASGAAGDDLVTVLRTAEEAARASVARTPELLPRLREAGVVDSGGLGIAVILAGLRMAVLGEALPDPPATPQGAVELSAVAHDGHGYCTEYLVERRDGVPLDRGAMLTALESTGGDSILVVGDPDALHVHLHLEDPGPGLSVGVHFGLLRDIKIDNMQLQHEAWSAAHRAGAVDGRSSDRALGLVAAATGPGIAAAFRELGALPLLDGAKPTPATFLEAARSTGSKRVFLLPNHVDAIMAAEQAAREEPELVRVIPARSIPAGIAAAVAYSPDGDAAVVAEAMQHAIEGVRCVEVTLAARDVQIGGVVAHEGQPIALLDHVLVATGATLEDALLAGLSAAVTASSEVISVYLGAQAPGGSADGLQHRLEAAFPDLMVEVVEGGQPYYPYVAGVE